MTQIVSSALCCGGESVAGDGVEEIKGEGRQETQPCLDGQGCVGLPSGIYEGPQKDPLPSREFCCPPRVQNLNFNHS